MLNLVYLHLLPSIYLALRILWKEKYTMQKQLSLWNRALRLFHLAISKFLKNNIFLLWNIIDIYPYVSFRCITWVSICMYFEIITTVSLVNTHHQHKYNTFFLENFSGGSRISLVAQMIKYLPTMRETRVHSLGQEDSLKKKMATHSCILA